MMAVIMLMFANDKILEKLEKKWFEGWLFIKTMFECIY
jgi:hypothetical protein